MEPQNSPAEPLSAESDAATPVKPTTPYVGYFVTVAGDQAPLAVTRRIEAELLNEGFDEVEATVEEHAGACDRALCGNMHSLHKPNPERIMAHTALFTAAQAWRDVFEVRLSRGVIVYNEVEQQLWEAVYAAEGRPFPLKGRPATNA